MAAEGAPKNQTKIIGGDLCKKLNFGVGELNLREDLKF